MGTMAMFQSLKSDIGSVRRDLYAVEARLIETNQVTEANLHEEIQASEARLNKRIDGMRKDRGQCPRCAWFVSACRAPGSKRLPVSGSEGLSGCCLTRQGQGTSISACPKLQESVSEPGIASGDYGKSVSGQVAGIESFYFYYNPEGQKARRPEGQKARRPEGQRARRARGPEGQRARLVAS